MLFYTAIAVLAAVAEAGKLKIYGNNQFCIGPEGAWDGARLQVHHCSDPITDVDRWSLSNGKSFFEFNNAWNRVLDVANGDTNTTPQIWAKGGPNEFQQFDVIHRYGGFLIRAPGNKCLDITEGDYSKMLQWYACAEGANFNQLFAS